MEAPKCRLCGERHWGGCPSLDRGVDRKPAPAPPPKAPATKAVKVPKPVAREPGSGKSTERVKRWRVANRERYNEVMRVYRAKRRGE
jgi:hypothetical protein